jgi:O-antigen/teichoic acid export membrane protein
VDYLGIQGLFSDILSMLSLADLGFGTAMTYSMYKPLAEEDYEKLAGLTTFYKKVYRIVAGVITVAGLGLIPFLKYLVNLESDIPHLTVYYVLYLANTIASYLAVYKTCIITADQKSYLITKYTSFFSIASTVCSCIFLLITKNYMVYLCVQVFFTYAKNFFNSYIAVKNYPFINKCVKLPKEETDSILKNVGSVFLYKISGVLINATDNTLISILVSTAAVGYYSNYTVITAKLGAFVNTLFYSLTASIGNLVVSESKEKRFEIFQIMQSVSNILSTFCVICIFFLQQDFIYVWLGADYRLDNMVLCAIVLNFYFSVSLLPIWVYREATGLYRKTRYVMLAAAGINIVLSILLGKWIGLSGILFATSVSRLLTYFWYEPKLLFKEYFGKSCLVYFAGIGKSILVTFVIFIVEYLTVGFIKVNSWPELIAKGILTVIISAVIIKI